MTSDGVVLLLVATLTAWLIALVLTAVAFHRRDSGTPSGRIAYVLMLTGWLILIGTIVALWLSLDRPPLRTLGETRLWYAAGLVGFALLIEPVLRTVAARVPVLVLGSLFLGLDVAMPSALDRTLRPALVSALFVPHVVTYLLSYAALGLAAGVAAWAWGSAVRQRRPVQPAPALLAWRFLLIGLPLLTLGMLQGAVWAKQAWGHYWAWDPKETWALITWTTYVILLHLARDRQWSPGAVCRALTLAFIAVLICWFAVAQLPSAQVSVHTYAQD